MGDPELAQYLNATYGIPTLAATIERTDEGVADLQRHTWTWQQPGQEASTVTIVNEPADHAFEAMEKWFWAVGDGIVKLDATFVFGAPRGGILAHGMFEPPMLMAQVADGAFAGVAKWFPTGDGTGEFVRYRDRFCEEPVP